MDFANEADDSCSNNSLHNKNNNVDWETTCLLYNKEGGKPEESDALLSGVRTEYRTFASYSASSAQQEVQDWIREAFGGSSNTSSSGGGVWSGTCTTAIPDALKHRGNGSNSPVSVAIMELPILTLPMAIFAQPEFWQSNYYRFWMLYNNNKKDKDKYTDKEQQPPLCLKLIFFYQYDDETETGDAAMSNDGYPTSVLVQLSPNTPYPETWPHDQRESWLNWLQQQATCTLQEQYTSFSVCAFLEHHALDYFHTISLSEQEGTVLVLFAASTTHWQSTNPPLDSLVFNPLSSSSSSSSTYGMVKFDAKSGTKRPTTPAELWPKAPKSPQDGSRPQPAKYGRKNHNNNHQPTELHWTTEGTTSKQFHDDDDHHHRQWWLHPCILQHEKWLPRSCPICLDDQFVLQDMVVLDCHHHVCRDCFAQYAAIQVQEISNYRRLKDNPFTCPIPNCRQGMRVMKTVKPFLSAADMQRVRAWYFDLKNPVSTFLPQCLDCEGGGVMRKTERDAFCVSCQTCGVRRCEYCIERLGSSKTKGKSNNKTNRDHHQDASKFMDHLSTTCKGAQTLKLARRYWRADKELQQRCEAKYPWIKVYAKARVGSVLAIREWLNKNEGQVCPSCSHGVVREEGCFHIRCGCGAHFCYECGEELFPPYYGTHHCWENR
ncbi:hypothetical protein ACA910_015798 [Epithemia clementina (nom. ined.)]